MTTHNRWRGEHISLGPRTLPALPSEPVSEPLPEPFLPRWLRTADNISIRPVRGKIVATLHYFTHPWYRIPRAILWWSWRGACKLVYQVVPTVRGVGRTIDGVYHFCGALDRKNAVALSVGTASAPRAAEKHCNAKVYRLWIIVFCLIIIVGSGLWLAFTHPVIAGVAGVSLLGLLDHIGRQGQEPKEALPRITQPLAEGRPTSQVKLDIDTILISEGYAREQIDVVRVTHNIYQHAFVVELLTHTEVKPELLRQLERRLYASPHSIHMAVNKDDASHCTLTIRLSNPLASVPEAPWLTAGSVSAWQPLDFGVSSNPDKPFELSLAGIHMRIISRTGGGKTVHLNNIIDRGSACRDVILCGASLIKSAVFDAWRSVLYKKAENVQQMAELLTWGLEQIDQRDQLFKKLRSDDNPNNDPDNWGPEYGPAIVILIDEFPELARYNGKGAYSDEPNLLELAISILRLGRGYAVSLILVGQGSGIQNFGSTLMDSQSVVTIVGPVHEDDTVALLGKDKRNQGYAPHLLQPSVPSTSSTPEQINDAGMAVVDAPGFGPDHVRGYRPFRVKARAMRREAEWLQMGNRPVFVESEHRTVDAMTVPPALAAVDAALTYHNVSILSTDLVVAHANAQGGQWTQNSLAEALKKEIPGNTKGDVIRSKTERCRIQKRSLSCYLRDHVNDAFDALEEGP